MAKNNLKTMFKCALFFAARSIGIFRLAAKVTQGKYRVICYHAASIKDEHLFWPGVFITTDVFRKHIQLVHKYSYKVLELDQLVNNVIHRTLPDNCMALTFDDGFYSTSLLEPILKEANYPATLYVTTYYTEHQHPIFNVMLSYMFFKTTIDSFEIKLPHCNEMTFMTKETNGTHSLQTINKIANQLDIEKRDQILRDISIKLELDFEEITNARIFHNLNKDELQTLSNNGVFNLQLHTHRHNLPKNSDEAIYEIETNRQILSEITNKKPNEICHFCYPSGIWNEDDFVVLKKLNIKSATTLDHGLNDPDTPLLAIKRILANDTKPLILFEGEICGFNHLLITLLSSLKVSKK